MTSKPLIPSSTGRPGIPQPPSLGDALQMDLKYSTLLLIGACLQCLFFLMLPKIYALVPAVFLLTAQFANAVLITKGMKANPYLRNVLFARTTAQVLDKNAMFAGPGQEKVAVLLLGSKSNHPLGFFAPDYNRVGGYLQKMTKELESPDSQDNGFLGQTQFIRKDENGATQTLMISYWRSIEHVHAYAHSPLHRKAWLWWDKSLAMHKHIGLMHEVFEAPKGMWEGIYVNFQPTMLGATTYLKKDGKLQGGDVSPEWVSGLLEANRGRMKTALGRRGQTSEAAEKDAFGMNYYT